MARVTFFGAAVLGICIAHPAAAQEADERRAAAIPLGTVLRVTLPTQGGPLVALGPVTQLRDDADCLHLTLEAESETMSFGVRVADEIVIERQLGTPRPDGAVPADPRWVAVPHETLRRAGIDCIQGI